MDDANLSLLPNHDIVMHLLPNHAVVMMKLLPNHAVASFCLFVFVCVFIAFFKIYRRIGDVSCHANGGLKALLVASKLSCIEWHCVTSVPVMFKRRPSTSSCRHSWCRCCYPRKSDAQSLHQCGPCGFRTFNSNARFPFNPTQS